MARVERVSNDLSAGPSELPLLVGAATGTPEELLLIGPAVGGRVLVRRWRGDDWSAPPVPTPQDADALLQWVEAQAAAGRTINQSLYGVRLWLRGEGVPPVSR